MPTIMCLSGVPQLQLFSCASMYPDARQITPIPREPERRWAAVGTNVESERSEEEGHMKTIRFLILRMFLLFAFFAMYLYGQDRGQVIPIVRNVAWNDLIAQIDPTVDEPAKETLGKELIRIQNFLREHQSDVNVGVYDVTVFRTIDHVRARLQKADKDLETIKNELPYKEEQAKLGK